jgi:hypothetical protein
LPGAGALVAGLELKNEGNANWLRKIREEYRDLLTSQLLTQYRVVPRSFFSYI